MKFRQLAENEIQNWYEKELLEAFAPQECKPLEDIRKLMAEGRYEIWGLVDGDELLGYATLWMAPGIPLVLLDYLGVTAKRRSSGLGAEILQRLKAQGRAMVLESEEVIPGGDPEENHIRSRRIAFYKRNGFEPVYRMATCGMAWQAMLYDPSGTSLDKIMNYHRKLYGSERSDVEVPLPQGREPKMPYWMK
ncbi:MAG: GNAT family N-acetyltransferase [Eubacteriales bacterium]|nr:GNAT family N-acetyltransferase [Eubacteriales bacterium]